MKKTKEDTSKFFERFNYESDDKSRLYGRMDTQYMKSSFR